MQKFAIDKKIKNVTWEWSLENGQLNLLNHRELSRVDKYVWSMRVNEFSEVVLLCSLCGIFFFSQYRRTSKSPCIIECQPASTDFAYIGKESVFGWDVLCSVSNSSYTVRIREKKCPLKMKWLWYESKSSCEREDFFCPEYRIECAKSSIIECDIFIIDSCFYESEAHHLWFVVLPSTIVSWDEDTLYLSSFVEFFCSLDTCSEKEVWALWSRRCSEKKSKLIFRDSIHVFIYSLISCHTDKNPRKYEDDERTDEKKKEFTYHWWFYDLLQRDIVLGYPCVRCL